MNTRCWKIGPSVVAALTVVLTVVIAAGCAGRYGSIRWDNGVEKSFVAGQVLPGHRYYTAGSDTTPLAILALREDHPLRSDLWAEVTMTPEILARFVDRMRGTRTEGPWGRVVLDDRNNPIGAWYSVFDPTPVKLLDDGGVVVAPPMGDTQGTMSIPRMDRDMK